MISNGKPDHIAGSAALGCLLAPVLLFGGGWLVGKIAGLLQMLLGG